MCINTEGECEKEMEPDCSQQCTAKGHKVEYKKFWLHKREEKRLFYWNGDQTLEQFVESSYGVSNPDDIQNSTGHGPE